MLYHGIPRRRNFFFKKERSHTTNAEGGVRFKEKEKEKEKEPKDQPFQETADFDVVVMVVSVSISVSFLPSGTAK